MFACKKKMESSVSNFPENDNIAERGAEAGRENFATCCKLSSTEILRRIVGSESTNMMSVTGILSQLQDVLVITMTGNQFGAQLPQGSKGTMIKNDAVTSMMLFKRASRTNAPNMRRERVSQNPWKLAFLQIPDQTVASLCVRRTRFLSPNIGASLIRV